MSEEENFFTKAFYLGVGIASYAAEKAGDAFKELKQQADKIAIDQDFPLKLQKIADDMVQKGKMTAEDAKGFVDDMVKQAQLQSQNDIPTEEKTRKPRTIEIITDDDD